MSNLRSSVLEARERFNLLRNIHSLFDPFLPTIENAESGQYGAVSGDSLTNLLNDIGILRLDIKCLPIKLQHVDFDQVASEDDFKQLLDSFDSLLGLFEESVLDIEEARADTITPQNTDYLASFPKLVTLSRLQQHGSKFVVKDAFSTDSHDILVEERLAASGIAGLPEIQTSSLRPGEASYCIEFPPPHKKISECRFTVEHLGSVIAKVFSDTIRPWDVQSLSERVTNDEIEYLTQAHAFSRVSSSLFQLLLDCITCDAEHTARLHLSGFHMRQFEMLLGTSEDDWIAARFKLSTKDSSLRQTFEHNICAHTATSEYRNRTIEGFFDESTLWGDCILDHALYDVANWTTSPGTLDDHFKDLTLDAGYQPSKLHLKILGVLLACSLFQLCGSPWLQHGFERERILILPVNASHCQMEYRSPHISCVLRSDQSTRSLPEDVAALGVLILEFEASMSARWTDEDEDYYTEKKSNKMRLSRVLREWKCDLTDFYHDIGSACFHFEDLVNCFEHPQVDEGLRSLAVLYKCIVNPLFQKLVSDFASAKRLFPGVPGLSTLTRRERPPCLGGLKFYDDWESIEANQKSGYADELIRTMEIGFLNKIKNLRRESSPIGLAENVRGTRTPEKIRIAILDTGVDPTNPMIRGAILGSRINGKRSFVGSTEDFIDSYGHGTHVTRFLLMMAPAAELYIAKITDGKNVDPEDMSRIAEAIDWAVKKWDVHIISMSFGFDEKNTDIDNAIEGAFSAKKLMFAAASNEGGNKGRSRPGKNPRVICIHACDGKGNKGDMSPSPMSKRDNFATLGVGIKSRWKQKDVYKSGTSFATPIAAAFAADILEFANFKIQFPGEDEEALYKQEGMEEVFRAMSKERDGYDYIQPGHLWNGRNDDEVAKIIRDAVRNI